MNLVAWKSRPREEMLVLAPPFLAICVAEACIGFQKEADLPLPLTFAVIAPVFALHKETRAQLPASVASSFPVWIFERPEIRATFSTRAEGFAPRIREAIVFALETKTLAIEAGGLRADAALHSRIMKLPTRTNDSSNCLKAAYFMGRWFARMRSPATVCSILGVTP